MSRSLNIPNKGRNGDIVGKHSTTAINMVESLRLINMGASHKITNITVRFSIFAHGSGTYLKAILLAGLLESEQRSTPRWASSFIHCANTLCYLFRLTEGLF